MDVNSVVASPEKGKRCRIVIEHLGNHDPGIGSDRGQMRFASGEQRAAPSATCNAGCQLDRNPRSAVGNVEADNAYVLAPNSTDQYHSVGIGKLGTEPSFVVGKQNRCRLQRNGAHGRVIAPLPQHCGIGRHSSTYGQVGGQDRRCDASGTPTIDQRSTGSRHLREHPPIAAQKCERSSER